MAVTVETHNTGDANLQRELVAIVEHVLSDRTGDWRVVILGSQGTDRWEMKLPGPIGSELSYTTESQFGQHEPGTVAAIITKMLPNRG